MPFFIFQWSQARIEHVADNGISREDFEQVVRKASRVESSRSSGRPCVRGRTRDGRLIFCVFEIVDDVYAIPVTAFTLGEALE